MVPPPLSSPSRFVLIGSVVVLFGKIAVESLGITRIKSLSLLNCCFALVSCEASYSSVEQEKVNPPTIISVKIRSTFFIKNFFNVKIMGSLQHFL